MSQVQAKNKKRFMNMVMNNRAIGLDKEQIELRRVYELNNKIFIFLLILNNKIDMHMGLKKKKKN